MFKTLCYNTVYKAVRIESETKTCRFLVLSKKMKALEYVTRLNTLEMMNFKQVPGGYKKIRKGMISNKRLFKKEKVEVYLKQSGDWKINDLKNILKDY